MSLSIFTLAIETFAPMLRTLSQLLDKGVAHARVQQSDPNELAKARLIADMYPLSLQVQLACEQARSGTALLMGQAPPPRQEIDASIDGLKACIAQTVDFLQSVPATALDGAAEREIELPLHGELVLEMKGHQFLRDWALPHFYFHVVTAYDILRHQGVEIGKRDYLSHVGSAIHQRGKPTSEPTS